MNYEIVRPIGRGGMGEVYLARDPRLHREVALKTLRRDLAGTELEPRLREEARLLARLNHPHIVQIHDITEYEGRLALVMEHVEGQNLHIALREKRGSPGDLLRWLAEVAAALACAHGAGIAHRDLKPENVLITRDGTAKVTDFGIAAEAAGAGDRADDLLALGRLGARLLEDIPDPSPAVRHLVDRLQSRRASQRPQAEDAAEALRLAWHESQQEETAPPRDRPGRSPGLPLAALAAVLALASAAAWWLLTPDNGPQRVAVLEPRITADGELSEDQLAGLRTTVQQALRQAALEDPALELIGQAETAALAGTPRTLAAALGADEVIAPTLRCGSRGCDLAIERTDPAGAVLNRRASSLPVEAELASYNVVLQQWRLLYPERNPAEARPRRSATRLSRVPATLPARTRTAGGSGE